MKKTMYAVHGGFWQQQPQQPQQQAEQEEPKKKKKSTTQTSCNTASIDGMYLELSHGVRGEFEGVDAFVGQATVELLALSSQLPLAIVKDTMDGI